MSEGELKKRIKKGRFYCSECRSYEVYEDDAQKVLDEAKKDLYSTIHDDCYWYNEGGCSDQHWTIYHKQPDDCPLRKLEKWFGDANL
jgi:hypothetical protein